MERGAMSTDLDVNALLDVKDFNKGLERYRAAVEALDGLAGREPKVRIKLLPPSMSREGLFGLFWGLWRYNRGWAK
jgi:hypothetical protein